MPSTTVISFIKCSLKLFWRYAADKKMGTDGQIDCPIASSREHKQKYTS